jgi:hypothetical protein
MALAVLVSLSVSAPHQLRPTVMLLGSTLMLRLAVLGCFPSGVKWKTLRSQYDDEDHWRWSTLKDSLQPTMGPSISSLFREGSSMSEHPWWLGIAVMAVVGGIAQRLQCWAVLLAALALITVPMTLFHGAVAATILIAVHVFCSACWFIHGPSSIQLMLWLPDVVFWSFGRSISISDVTFSHLLGSASTTSSSWRWASCCAVFIWHHAGRLLCLSVTVPWLPSPPWQWLRRCVLRHTVVLGAAVLVATWMDGHLFQWSVFFPSVAFSALDLLWYLVMSVVALLFGR